MKINYEKSLHVGYGINVGESSKHIINLKSHAYNKKGRVKFKEGGRVPKQLDEALSNLFNANYITNNINKDSILDSDF